MASPGHNSPAYADAVINNRPSVIPTELSAQIFDIEVELISLRREAQRKKDTFESSQVAYNAVLLEQKKCADKVLHTESDLLKLKSLEDDASTIMSAESKAKHRKLVSTLEIELQDVNEKAKAAEEKSTEATEFIKRTELLNNRIISRVYELERRLHELCGQRVKTRKEKMDELNTAYDVLAGENDADFTYMRALEQSFNKSEMLKETGEESPYDSETEALYS